MKHIANVKKYGGASGDKRSKNIAMSFKTSANSLHLLASMSSRVPLDQAKSILASIPDPSEEKIEVGSESSITCIK